MSDDRQEPPAGEHDDRTRPLPPTAGRPEPSPPTGPATPAAASPDETMPIDRAASPDETAPMDRAASGPAASPDETMPIDRSAQTQPGAPVDRTARMPAERATPAPWSGRAEVRAARPAEPSGEWYAEEQGGRRWWLPILWGVLALLLAGLLGAALWVALAAQNDDRDDDPGPTPSLPPPSATSAAPTSAAPTSAAPTSETPSSPAATSAPAEVPVPPLTGLPQATAEGLLDRLGLSYRVVYRPSELPPGTVVGTEPDAGTSVPTDEEVLLIVSEAQPSTGASTAGPSPTVTPTQ
ncbi:PASTA domain-containing protein [Micromonospora sp. BL4]|uniref:PASTA domain-containing protein n=1 Tax=Micromonospora sp. BL4 TaxID=2478710 RepID=UPI000EF60D97|nr:PASTA domain-containing protein [Micromonospora sp. BL4]RLP92469.1 PASTA domain-containing protein [Micromonospora sp. BL4]